MTVNPFQPPDLPPRNNKQWTVRQVIGLCLVVIAVPSFGRIERPPNSTGNFVDDMPFIGGQLFVGASILTIGMFLLLRKRK